jgi:hypothetical protein
MGLEAMFFARISPEQDTELIENVAREFIWQPEFGDDNVSIFCHKLAKHYNLVETGLVEDFL